MTQNILSNKRLLGLFFLSGVTSLLYQMSWIRIAADIFGSTVAALSSVTAVVFAGMALGSISIAQSEKPLQTKHFAHLQIGIAFTALLSIPLFLLSDQLMSGIYTSLSSKPFMNTFFRLLLLTLTIGPAAYFSGATFPLMVNMLTSSPLTLGKTGSFAFSFNSLGAVGGTLFAGLILIPHAGIHETIYGGALVNLLVAAMVLKGANQTLDCPEKESVKIALYPTGWLFFALGVLGMGTEMLWGRFLSLIIVNTVYLSMYTLAAIILGLAIGSLWGGRIATQSKKPLRMLGILLIAGLVSLLAALFLPASLWRALAPNPNVEIAFVLFAMFLPALFSGTAFPIILQVITPSEKLRGKAAGQLSAMNTLGCIIGALGVGLVLIPFWGLLNTILSIALLQVGIIVATFVIAKAPKQLFALLLLPVAIVFLFGTTSSTNYMKAFLSPTHPMLFLQEGKQGDVTVVEAGKLRIMEINRLWQGESRKTRQIMAAHLPMLLHQGEASKVLVVGVGPGVTAHRFLMYPIDSLHLVDIEEGVFTAAEKYFGATWMSDDPRVKKIVADGRQHINYTTTKYDCISIEIGQVFRPHSAQFYTKDFYTSADGALSPGGVITQFIPIASFNDATFKTVIRTFVAQFPNSQLWFNRSEFILLGFKDEGTQRQQTLDPARLSPLMDLNHPVGRDLMYSYWGGSAFNLNQLDVLAAGYLMGPEDLQKLVGKGPLFKANRPSLEYYAAANQQNPPFLEELIPFLSNPATLFPPAKSDPLLHERIIRIREENLQSIVAEALMMVYEQRKEIALLEQAFAYNPSNLQLNILLGRAYFADRKLEQAIKHLDMVTFLEPQDHSAALQLATAYLQNNEYDKAVARIIMILEQDPQDDKAHTLLGYIMAMAKKYDVAYYHLSEALKINPENKEAKLYIEKLTEQYQWEQSQK